MRLGTLEIIDRGMDEADATHNKAAARILSGRGTRAGLDAIALALLAIDQRILTLSFGWLEEKRDEIREQEKERELLKKQLLRV